MLKIETGVHVSEEFPKGKSSSYVWINGQKWPVPEAEESEVQKIEAFGDELELPQIKQLAGGKALEQLESSGEKKVLMRSWYGDDARYVSRQLRMFYR